MGTMHTDSDTGSINVDDELPSSNEPAASTTDRETRFWKKYLEEADNYDRDFIRKNGSNVEGVLIFAGLFSAVSASFLGSIRSDLQPNPTDTTNALLMMLVNANNNSALSNQSLGIPVWDGPSTAVVSSQILGYAGLSASLLAALGAVLGKQWLSDFTRLRSGPLQERGRRRQQKLDGLKRWQFEVFMEALPALLQLALLLFGIALAIDLWELNHGVGLIIIIATAIGVLFYFCITLASLLSPTCPYHTPVSSAIYTVVMVTMKSLEAIADYWAWNSGMRRTRRPTISQRDKILANIAAVFFSLLLTIASPILLAILTTFGSIFVFVTWIRGSRGLLQTKMDFYRSALQFKTLRQHFHKSMCSTRDSTRSALHSTSRALLDPVDSRPIAWLLETSTDPDCFMAAVELVPDAKWPDDLHISLANVHMCSRIFIHSISEEGFANERALRFGKAFVIVLCQTSNEISARVWRPVLTRIIALVKPDVHPDLRFIIIIVIKLLSHGLGSESPVEFPSTLEVSQSLLAWLLQPLEILLRPDHPRRSSFLPEAHRVFLKLNWPEEPMLKGVEEMQYFQTFDAYFECVMSSNVEQTDETTDQSLEKWNKVPAARLKKILEKLKKVDPTRLSEVHQYLIAPFSVLSRLASIPHFEQVIKDAAINPWMLSAFKEVVGNADGGGTTIWFFASFLIQLATDVDAFNPIEARVENPFRNAAGYRKMPSKPLLMDSTTLLSYLLNKVTSATPEQVVYALQIMLSNVDEYSMLASNPHFINYILCATGPGQLYSVRNIGLKVLIAICQFLLRTYDTVSLVRLAADCDFVRFLPRAILHQDPPTILKDFLQINDEGFNETLLGILAPVVGDPFNAILTKLKDEMNEISDRDLHDLEIALVLSNSEGRQRLFFDHLDHCIAKIPLWDYQYAMALPLTVIVGWLLRRDRPLGSSESVWKAFLRPDFELLLFSAWGDPDVLEDNPHMLRMLLDCTARWLSTYVNPGTGASSQPPSDATLARLQHSLDQLRSRNQALSWDIKKALHRLSREIRRHGQV